MSLVRMHMLSVLTLPLTPAIISNTAPSCAFLYVNCPACCCHHQQASARRALSVRAEHAHQRQHSHWLCDGQQVVLLMKLCRRERARACVRTHFALLYFAFDLTNCSSVALQCKIKVFPILLHWYLWHLRRAVVACSKLALLRCHNWDMSSAIFHCVARISLLQKQWARALNANA